MSWLGGKGKSKEPVTPVAKSTGGGRMAQSAIESTIGANTHIKGDIQGDGGLRVDGVVEGTIELTGNLVITESAKVRAEIKANNVSIAGAVQGNVSANRVEVTDTGRVWGDMTIKALLVSEGAYLRGQTFMSQDLQPPKLEPPKPAKSNNSLPTPQAGTVVDVMPEEKADK
ncbi:MAG: polymer-forming cytoskeletal protein [Anaerolineae bacterium]